MSREHDLAAFTQMNEELDRRIARKNQVIGALCLEMVVTAWLVRHGGKEDTDLVRIMEMEVNRIRREGA